MKATWRGVRWQPSCFFDLDAYISLRKFAVRSFWHFLE